MIVLKTRLTEKTSPIFESVSEDELSRAISKFVQDNSLAIKSNLSLLSKVDEIIGDKTFRAIMNITPRSSPGPVGQSLSSGFSQAAHF